MEIGRFSRVSRRVYEALFLAYPKEFREEYGPHMAQVFEDSCREEYRRSGAIGLVGLWIRVLLDLGKNAFTERSKTIRRGPSYLGRKLLTLRKLMVVNAAVVLAFGFTLTYAPAVIEVYGFTPPTDTPTPIGSSNPEDWVGMAFARFFGVTCLAFGLLLWATSRVAETEARRAVSGVLSLVNLLGVPLLLNQQTAVWLSTVGMITVIVHFLFALAYGAFWLESFNTLTSQPLNGRQTANSPQRNGMAGKI